MVADRTEPSTTRRVQRYAVAAALVAFPVLLVAQAPIDPASGGTGEVMYAAASEQAGALLASAVLIMISGLLMVPAVAGLVHLARGRGAALATLAAALGVLGGFGHFAIGMFYLVALALPGGDPGQMVAYVERLNAHPALTAIALPLILCFGFGVVAMSWAAWRIGLLGWWAPVLVTAVVLMHTLLPISSISVEIGGLAALTTVFGYLGIRIARMSDTAWDRSATSETMSVPATP
jgi:hypothetical protein